MKSKSNYGEYINSIFEKTITPDNINNVKIWKLIKWGNCEYYLDSRTNTVYMEDYNDMLKVGTWYNNSILEKIKI